MEGFIFSTLGDVTSWKEVDFIYKKTKIKTKSPAIAVAKVENLKTFFFLPHSLFKEEIVDEVNSLTFSSKFTLTISPSFGKYGKYKYSIGIEQLKFYYFYHFVKSYFKLESKADSSFRFVIDISTGLNQLTFAMTEAFKLFQSFVNLFTLQKLQNKRNNTFEIIYSEPVIGKYEFNIFKENITKSETLFLPIEWQNFHKLQRIINKLPMEDDLKSKINLSSENALYIITSILKNFPLVIYEKGYEKSKGIKTLILKLTESLEPIMGNEKNPPSFKIYDDTISYYFSLKNFEQKLLIKLFLLLAAYKGTTTIFDEVNIKCNGEKYNDIFKKFRKIYSKILGNNSPNEILLAKDIKRIDKIIASNSYLTTKDSWIKIQFMDEKFGSYRPNIRNFIAHSGLISNILKYNPQTKVIKYTEEGKKLIRKFLEKSIS